MEERFASTFVISLTAYDADGGLDEENLRAHLRRLGASGIGVYVGGSGSGEGYTLDPAERRRVLEIAKEELGERVPVRAMGVEPRSALEMIGFGREVAEVGLDAMQLYSLDPGHGYHPRREELEAFLIEVLEAVTCPVVLSSHQAMGYGLPPDLVAQMLERFPHVIGINFTNPDLGALVRMLEAVDGRVDVHVGGPMQTLTALALGATGYLSSEGNLAPRLCQSVIAHHRVGELLLRDAAFAKLLLLHVATQRLGGASAAKGALRELGLPGGWPRRPRLPVSDEHARELAACFESLGLREVEDVS
ncbi:MAG: dihydrodipicolinate synthase family protein [Myxococcales bacterium]|nr:dihydrodipicolinate synthase family protein [Myxococcales bacterium]